MLIVDADRWRWCGSFCDDFVMACALPGRRSLGFITRVAGGVECAGEVAGGGGSQTMIYRL